jgi:hypothetical protein
MKPWTPIPRRIRGTMVTIQEFRDFTRSPRSAAGLRRSSSFGKLLNREKRLSRRQERRGFQDLGEDFALVGGDFALVGEEPAWKRAWDRASAPGGERSGRPTFSWGWFGRREAARTREGSMLPLSPL